MDVGEFRDVMRNLAAGVTIVTTSLDGSDYGMTATSFNSVSLDPLTVQVSLSHESRTYKAISSAGFFAANILGAHQEPIARTCALKADDPLKNIPAKPGAETGAPLIEEAIGHLECRVSETLEKGDHTVFMGEVLAGAHEMRPPLLYFQGDYYRLTKEDE